MSSENYHDNIASLGLVVSLTSPGEPKLMSKCDSHKTSLSNLIRPTGHAQSTAPVKMTGSSGVVQNIQAITSANRLSKGVIEQLESQIAHNESLVKYYQGNMAYLSSQYKWLLDRIDSKYDDGLDVNHDTDYENIKSVVEEVTDTFVQIRQLISSMNSLLMQRNQSLQSYQQRLESLSTQVDKLQHARDVLQARLANLDVVIQSLEQRKLTETDRLIALRRTNEDVTQSLNDAQHQVHETLDHIKRVDADIETVEGDMRRLKGTLESLTADRLMNEEWIPKYITQIHDLEEFDHKYKSGVDSINASEKQIACLSIDIKAKEGEILKYSEKSREIDLKLEEIHDDNILRAEQIVSITDQLESVQDQTTGDIKKKSSLMQQQIEGLNFDLKSLKEELQESLRELSSVHDQTQMEETQMADEISLLYDALGILPEESLTALISMKSTSIHNCSEKLLELKHIQTDYDAQIEKLHAQVVSLENTGATYSKEHSTSIENLTKEAEDIHSQSIALEQDIINLKKVLEEYRNNDDLHKSFAELRQLKLDFQNLHTQEESTLLSTVQDFDNLIVELQQSLTEEEMKAEDEYRAAQEAEQQRLQDVETTKSQEPTIIQEADKEEAVEPGNDNLQSEQSQSQRDSDAILQQEELPQSATPKEPDLSDSIVQPEPFSSTNNSLSQSERTETRSDNECNPDSECNEHLFVSPLHSLPTQPPSKSRQKTPRTRKKPAGKLSQDDSCNFSTPQRLVSSSKQVRWSEKITFKSPMVQGLSPSKQSRLSKTKQRLSTPSSQGVRRTPKQSSTTGAPKIITSLHNDTAAVSPTKEYPMQQAPSSFQPNTGGRSSLASLIHHKGYNSVLKTSAKTHHHQSSQLKPLPPAKFPFRTPRRMKTPLQNHPPPTMIQKEHSIGHANNRDNSPFNMQFFGMTYPAPVEKVAFLPDKELGRAKPPSTNVKLDIDDDDFIFNFK